MVAQAACHTAEMCPVQYFNQQTAQVVRGLARGCTKIFQITEGVTDDRGGTKSGEGPGGQEMEEGRGYRMYGKIHFSCCFCLLFTSLDAKFR